MRWITRERVKVDRVACPWVIRKFVDSEAEFYFVPAHQVMSEAQKFGARPVRCSVGGARPSRERVFLRSDPKKYNLSEDPALALLAKIVNGADTDNTLWNRPEAAGLKAVAEGFRHLGFKD